MTEIPLAPLDRIVRKAGAERVSISAAKALRESLEEIGRDISQRAIELSRHAGRKTVIAEDIKLAYNQWKR
ncbi:MAG: histone family protein [Asgard group archaeon]